MLLLLLLLPLSLPGSDASAKYEEGEAGHEQYCAH